MIFFLNYKPEDDNLGSRANDTTLNAEDEEKKIKLKIEKYVQKSIANLDVSINSGSLFLNRSFEPDPIPRFPKLPKKLLAHVLTIP